LFEPFEPSDTNLTSVVYEFVVEDTYRPPNWDMYYSLQAELICLLLMSNWYKIYMEIAY